MNVSPPATFAGTWAAAIPKPTAGEAKDWDKLYDAPSVLAGDVDGSGAADSNDAIHFLFRVTFPSAIPSKKNKKRNTSK